MVLLRRWAGLPVARLRQQQNDLGPGRRDVSAGRGGCGSRPIQDLDLAHVHRSLGRQRRRHRNRHCHDHAHFRRDSHMHIRSSRARPTPSGQRDTARNEVRARAPLRRPRALPPATAGGLPDEDRPSQRLAPARDDHQTQPTLFSLPVTFAPTYLDIRGAEPNPHADRYPNIEQQLGLARPRPTVYFHLAYQPA